MALNKTPVTMLSGFLGAGKTTILRFVLENSKEKIACIVNDVASVNIDAKLVRNDRNRADRDKQVNTTADLADTIELANGCACCNLQDELFASFEKILALATKRGEPYTRIILENSGVAEPQQLRDKFNEAAMAGHPLMEHVELDSMVTVVDSSTFVADYASRAPLAARPELGEGGNMRPVVDLLVEQVECADFIVLNKADLLGTPEALEQLSAITSSLNPLATIVPAQHGKIPIEIIFGKANTVVAKLNVEGQHRGAVAAARAIEGGATERAHDHKDGHAHHHDHEHQHGHEHHELHHDHEHGGESCKACQEEKADGHDHYHHHHEGEGAAEDCAACKHEGHGDHEHHHHHHHHEHKSAETRAASRFGITSFVYSRRRPFHPVRLREMVLRWLPVTTNTALEGAAPAIGDSPIKTVMRSKGFMWLSSSHKTAYYWSHAGQHFEIRDEGDWWAAVDRAEWPSDPAQVAVVEGDFDSDNRIGDRRLEIVFIGVNMEKDKICSQLDDALLTDEEMQKYWERWHSSAAA